MKKYFKMHKKLLKINDIKSPQFHKSPVWVKEIILFGKYHSPDFSIFLKHEKMARIKNN